MYDTDLHPRTLRSNIWRALLCASDLEIHEGMHFYVGANWICNLFATIFNKTPEQIAGMYAALSPMNTWDTNVANILDILRNWSSASVNTTDINFHKALNIAAGADPLKVLEGRKVTAFYRAIADPDDRSHIPVDRHLICLALGRKITSNQQLRSIASNNSIYTSIESAYQSLGAREGLGNRLASIAWFVQRRINGTAPLFHPGSPICCDRPMWTQGSKRFQCGTCKRTRVRQPSIRLKRRLPETILTDYSIPRDVLSADTRGRITIYLGVGHKYARSGGVSYLARYIVESRLGHRLRTDEHVHHVNGILADCRLSNLEVWLADRHGRYHARTQLLYMFRDDKGRFAPSQVPAYSDQPKSSYDLDPDLAHHLDLDSAAQIRF